MIGIFSFVQPGHVPNHYQQSVLIANLLSIIFGGVTIGVAVVFHEVFGMVATIPYIYLVAMMFFAVPLVNRWSSNRIGRMIFCLVPVLLTMVITLHFKMHQPPHADLPGFDSRFILMVSPILPGIVFRLDERKHLLICLGVAGLCVYFYDFIHFLLGVPTPVYGIEASSYQYVSYIISFTFTILVFGIFLLRSVLERSERDLLIRNRMLQEKQAEIEAQHEELLVQQEEMVASSEKLEVANSLITKQQDELESYNAALERLVAEKSQELVKANEELIKYNNELLQFSYTVSHNLRGPVARLMGLTHLLQVTPDPAEKEKIGELVARSSEELDTVLKDLTLIIDTRNEIYRLREKVSLAEEWQRAIVLLGENAKKEYSIRADFDAAPHIFGVRPMIQSILYNLLSNAIKYQSPERKLEISIRSYRRSRAETVIDIVDNGLGFDLAAQSGNVFKLYKRFHSHVEGKGLGLYLVKTQVDAMGGTISISSAPGRGTSFSIVFPEPEAIRKQVFHETEAASVFYNGYGKVTVLQWKRPVTSEEYRRTFGVVLDSLKVYRTPGWISDVTRQGAVGEADQRWLLQTLGAEAIKSGLKQIGLVGFNLEGKKAYFDKVVVIAKRFDITVATFDSLDDAMQWMEKTLG